MNPFELADVIGFAVFALGGVAIGRRMRPRPPEPLRPICSCSHGYGTHDEGQRCRGETQRACKWDGFNDPCKWEYVPCPCARYDGPSPLMLGIEP